MIPRVPAGYGVPPERVELLLHDALYAGFALPVPAEAHTSAFAGFCAERWGRSSRSSVGSSSSSTVRDTSTRR